MFTRHLDKAMSALRTMIMISAATGAFAWTLLWGAEAHAQGQARCISLESKSAPGQFVRHFAFFGRTDPVAKDVDERDATFMMGPGLSGASGSVSFEATNFPGYYLRHQLSAIVLSKDDGSQLFKDDATFLVRAGLADQTLASFEASKVPGFYLHKRPFQGLGIDLKGPFAAPGFNSDATFGITTARSKSECGDNKKNPVIIVAATATIGLLYLSMRNRLQREGYNAYIFELPTLGMQDMKRSAEALKAFSDKVRARLRASKVDLIGHSQGAEVSRSYLKYLGGAKEVGSMISLGGPHYGTTVANVLSMTAVGAVCEACKQMASGSQYLKDLNAKDEVFATVSYTNFVTKLDLIIQPYASGLLRSTASNNVNVTVQDKCPLALVDHVTLISDGAVFSGILNALARKPITNLDCLALPNLLP
ncbi:MAG TPA: AbfB domain-containing protein [Kofleriaceae bacterium]|nr:AbfB domain-containing protein [Kofleriaceae bacterium]